VGAHRTSGRHPGDSVARHLQYLGGIAERVAALQAVRFGNPNALERDVAVLHNLERDLVLDLVDAEAGRRLVLDDEPLDLIVRKIARPNDGYVAPGSVADPPF